MAQVEGVVTIQVRVSPTLAQMMDNAVREGRFPSRAEIGRRGIVRELAYENGERHEEERPNPPGA